MKVAKHYSVNTPLILVVLCPKCEKWIKQELGGVHKLLGCKLFAKYMSVEVESLDKEEAK
jgi:hypothetical protein